MKKIHLIEAPQSILMSLNEADLVYGGGDCKIVAGGCIEHSYCDPVCGTHCNSHCGMNCDSNCGTYCIKH